MFHKKNYYSKIRVTSLNHPIVKYGAIIENIDSDLASSLQLKESDFEPYIQDTHESETNTFKVFLVGKPGLGKSCFTLRATADTFTPTHISTIGTPFKVAKIDYQNHDVTLQIWDPVGTQSNDFSKSGPDFYLIAVDLTDKASLSEAHDNIRELLRWRPEAKFMIVGMKADSIERKISTQEMEALAAKFDATFLETSSKDNVNIQTALNFIARELMQVKLGIIPKKIEESTLELKQVARKNKYDVTVNDAEHPILKNGAIVRINDESKQMLALEEKKEKLQTSNKSSLEQKPYKVQVIGSPSSGKVHLF